MNQWIMIMIMMIFMLKTTMMMMDGRMDDIAIRHLTYR